METHSSAWGNTGIRTAAAPAHVAESAWLLMHARVWMECQRVPCAQVPGLFNVLSLSLSLARGQI